VGLASKKSQTSAGDTRLMSEPSRHLQCPFCEAYEVERLYLASLRVDSCACSSCGARWDEDPISGEYRGRSFELGGLRPPASS
jgi:hypothetical protein